ncbi:MAG: polysaccharide deacetylase family protein [Minisyncoccia bacterium]
MNTEKEESKNHNLYDTLINISALLVFLSIFFFSYEYKILQKIKFYTKESQVEKIQSYNLSSNLEIKNNESLSPATSVPILMYHGVVLVEDVDSNTSRKNFISHMEMLKREGYETISVSELNSFTQGKFKLPPKPIIITFDDGRKDSYYTVDEVFEKLGFKGTIFIATTKAVNNDPFYLSWDELKILRDSGRWEIEAHGRRSHDEVPVDSEGNFGRFYSSRVFILGLGLESIKDFNKRVEADYISGIEDLKNNLGINPMYFAIPLGDYGEFDQSNYADSKELNVSLTKKYFKFAFTQAGASESFYNYADSNPYNLKRLDVKNITSGDLLRLLNKFSSKEKSLNYPDKDNLEILESIELLYGLMKFTDKGVELSIPEEKSSVRLIIGDRGWKDYSIKIEVLNDGGKSNSVLIYYQDEDNYIALNQDRNSLWIIEKMNGVEREIARSVQTLSNNSNQFELRVSKGNLSAKVNGTEVVNGARINLKRGAGGFSLWDPEGKGKSTIKKLLLNHYDF